MTTSSERSFSPGGFIIDDREMELVQIDLDCGVRVIYPTVLFHYEVSTRGRVIRLAPVTIDNHAINIEFVTTEDGERVVVPTLRRLP